MTHLKLGCILAFLLVVLALPAARSVNALSATSVNDAGRGMSSQSTVFAAAKKKRNVCKDSFKQCIAQCKKGSAENRNSCVDNCNVDDWWCTSVCGGTPC